MSGARRRPRRGRLDRGQAAVELALALPLVLLVLLGAVQVTLVARDQIAVVHAAREGARAAAVAAQPEVEGAAAARAATDLAADRLEVDVATTDGGARVRVTVRYRAPTDVPVVGGLLGDIALSATAVMAAEP